MGDDEHLVGAGHVGERPTDGRRRRASDAGIDLVEDERARSLVVAAEHEPQGEHRAGQLAA